MRKILTFLIISFLRMALWFRYRVTIKGFENLNEKTLTKPGGVLFLPNHPTIFVDPTLITLAIWKRFPIRPIVIEYMYYAPIANSIMKMINALPIPSFDVSTNSLKRKRSEKVLHEVVKGLENGNNFLIYPAGGVKNGPHEVIGGASGAHQVISESPNANIVLVRITGLWGSSFSKALIGKSPPMFATIWQGVKMAFKNLLFFTPRREVTIEFVPAGDEFPREASRLEMNRYLENWYNRPDGLSKTKSEHPGETLQFVSYSMWKEKYLPVQMKKKAEALDVDLKEIPEEVQEKVTLQLAKMTEKSPTEISPEQELSNDLGLDSLDVADLVVFIEDKFDIHGVPVNELTTVARVMGIASGKITVQSAEEEDEEIKSWKMPAKSERLTVADGKTLPEVFLNNCARKKDQQACGDIRSGILKYSTLKLRAILLAEYIKTLPGDHIGILLPASVAASVCILATQLAGKVPVMINWTVGPRHLEHVVSLSGIQKVLTSWSFIDRLANVDLANIDDLLLMLEDVRREFSLADKIKAYVRSKQSTKSILKHFKINNLSEDDRAVLLFTSGTENMPKGVPLSHKNVLYNQRKSTEVFPFHSDDVVIAMLPPFHSFGFTVSTFIPLLTGMKVAFTPDPTDGKQVAKTVQQWGGTIVCGAPTFLRNMLRAGDKETFKTLRLLVSGAEKAPTELKQMANDYGLGKIIEGYGVTECSPVLTVNPPDEEPAGVGKPIPGIDVKIVHPETHQPVAHGEEGLIIAKGPSVFSGYINKDVSSPFEEIDGEKWYITGDLGYFDKSSRLHISGRLKRFIKVGAEMVSLGQIEHALLDMASKKGWKLAKEGASIAVCAKERDNQKPIIHAFTVFPTSSDELNTALRSAGISNLVKITDATKLQEIPLMGIGKINYRELENQYIV